MRNFRAQALALGIDAAVKQGITTDPSGNGLAWREAIPNIDMNNPAANGYTHPYYLTSNNTTGFASATWTSVFESAAVPQMLNDRILVFYKCFDLSANPLITELKFMLGAGGTSTMGLFHLEGILEVKRTPEAWFSEPIVYYPAQFMSIQVQARAAVATTGERFGFGCFVIERAGQTIS
jgi:hypothetical protein